MFLSLRFTSHHFLCDNSIILSRTLFSLRRNCSFTSPLKVNPKAVSFFNKSIDGVQQAGPNSNNLSVNSVDNTFPFPGLEDALIGYISGKKKATEVAHSIWKHFVQKGDTVVDATCGNGYDTLAMLKLVADDSGNGCVYGMDIQTVALENTSLLLDRLVHPNERMLIKLFPVCHSRMEDVIPKDTFVRLVAFNLGYLPGGDKSILTVSETTLPALQAASRILGPGGLISLVVYVGHPGGREEFETVQTFASGLSTENWICCKIEMVNRQAAPVIVLLFKK
ncbi:PREDICTED: uncharacterized protein LOC104589231 isoform X2 [Nelumbo nucifera]|uniref:Uncharacterized protein LOC104589231 isoform X2 n=1 Tax=Nelumbo nucifera TaxID=4432 RepID=A0A1U7ZCY7_NELNU|nr:PREDICTED: uncharacterized protein LOC104589231 isoform X2 [Nelumbo nucifera]